MATIKKRPMALTVVCILGYIWITGSFPGVFSPFIKRLGDWYPALFGLFVAANFIALVGVWYMKKWGVQLYMASFFLKQIVLVFIDDVSYLNLTLSVIFIAFFLYYYKGMDENL